MDFESIPEEIKKQIKCSLKSDNHIVHEPILLKCGFNACKKCILECIKPTIYCFSCKNKHVKKELNDAPVNKIIESIISLYLISLTKEINMNLASKEEIFKNNLIFDEFKNKVNNIDLEIDLRVESLIIKIQSLAEDLRLELKEYHIDFENSLEDNNHLESSNDELEINENSYEIFKKKQNQLRNYQLKLDSFREKIKNLYFIPSIKTLTKEHVGEVMSTSNMLYKSLILNKQEINSIHEMINFSNNIKILYRASTDGYESLDFHNHCDGIENTITIIKDNFNNVFGGYTSAKWKSDGTYISDLNSFIFKLRNKGISCKNKFKIKNHEYAVLGNSNYGPIFGIYDILIKNKSNVNTGSCSVLFHAYESSEEYIELTGCSLSNNFNSWLTTEIEVYQIS